MKKLSYFFICSLITILMSCYSCKTSNKAIDNDSTFLSASVTSVKALNPDTLTILQLDSLTVADSLPSYIKWEKIYIKDGETNKHFEYGTLFDKEKGIIYTVKFLKSKSVYVVQKKNVTVK